MTQRYGGTRSRPPLPRASLDDTSRARDASSSSVSSAMSSSRCVVVPLARDSRAWTPRRGATTTARARSPKSMRVGELRDALRECGEWDAKTLGKSKKKELVEMYEALERRRALGEVMRGVAEEDEAAAAAEGASAAARDDARDEREDRAGEHQRTIFNSRVTPSVSGGSEEIEKDLKSNFSGAELTFLGTSSGAPSFTRNVSSVALRLDNEVWLFDCGEATQHQLMRSKLKYAKITRIFITHMHGDHIFGLPGLICAISGARTAHSRSYGGTAVPLHIIGPPGIRQYVYSAITWSRSVLGMPLIVTELRQPAPRVAASASPAAHTSVDPRGKIFMGEYWPDALDCEPVPNFKDIEGWSRLGEDVQPPVWTAYNDGSWCVRATVLRHPVPCFGYIIDECDASGRLDADKCAEMGLPPGREYAALKAGQSVTTKDGVVINPEDVIGERRPGRRLVHLGDTCNSSAVAPLARGADSLVHESTFNSKKVNEALFKGHSTATMAGTFAAKVKARALILTHFSNRYGGGANTRDSNTADLGAGEDEDDECEDMAPPSVDDVDALEIGDRMNVETLVEEAKEAKGDSRVVAASDFFVFNVGRRESFDEFDLAKGDRSALFAGDAKTVPPTFIVDDQDNRSHASNDDRKPSFRRTPSSSGHSTSPSRRSSTVGPSGRRPGAFRRAPPRAGGGAGGTADASR